MKKLTGFSITIFAVIVSSASMAFALAILPPPPQTYAAPTLNEWGMFSLAAAMGVAGLYNLLKK